MQNLPKNILIKTYTFESGLWYLANSLAKELALDNHNISFVPKVRYIKSDNKYIKYYPKSISNSDFKIFNMSEKESIGSQLGRIIQDNNIKKVISFETLMESSIWVKNIKERTGTKVIDVPMIEWVTPTFLENKSYHQFEQVWAITDHTFNIFKKYDLYNIIKKQWNFVNIDNRIRKVNNKYTFYHQASLNVDFSSKNTLNVILAFNKLVTEYNDIQLILTGNLNNNSIIKAMDNQPGISIFNNILNRDNIIDIYYESDCVVAPSVREGLGLSLFEAQQAGCSLITTDAPPMNELSTKYLCEVNSYRRDRSLVPLAEVNAESIYKQMKLNYLENHVKSNI